MVAVGLGPLSVGEASLVALPGERTDQWRLSGVRANSMLRQGRLVRRLSQT